MGSKRVTELHGRREPSEPADPEAPLEFTRRGWILCRQPSCTHRPDVLGGYVSRIRVRCREERKPPVSRRWALTNKYVGPRSSRRMPDVWGLGGGRVQPSAQGWWA